MQQINVQKIIILTSSLTKACTDFVGFFFLLPVAVSECGFDFRLEKFRDGNR